MNWNFRREADVKNGVFLISSVNQTGETELNKSSFEGFRMEEILQRQRPLQCLLAAGCLKILQLPNTSIDLWLTSSFAQCNT